MTELSDLPEDVIAKIVSFLPVESVVNLKRVRKSWNIMVSALVKTPSFVADHLHNSKNNRPTSSSFIFHMVTNNAYLVSNTRPSTISMDMKPTLLTLNHNKDEAKFNEAKFNEEKISDDLSRNEYKSHFLRRYKLFAHCNGLICKVNRWSGAIELRNPATGDLKLLRGPFFEEGFRMRIRNIGFGYDVVSDSYKVVEIIYRANEVIMAKVYKLGKDTSASSSSGWGKENIITDIPVINMFYTDNDVAVCIKGVCYWLGLFGGGRPQQVLCFDIHSEKFYTISLPKRLSLTRGLAQFKESVAFFRAPEKGALALEVWLMSTAVATKTKHWSKSFSIALHGSLLACRSPKPIGFWKNGDELLIDLGTTGYCDVVSYNLVENKYTRICYEASDAFIFCPYLASFVKL